MRDVAIERGEIGVPVHHAEQIGAHVDEIAGAAGRAVEPADQLLPPRLRGEVQGACVLVAGLGAPFLDRLGQALPIGAEIAHQSVEEGAASHRIQLPVDVEHLTRHRGAGGFAPARQQRIAELDQPVGIPFGVSGVSRRSSVRPRSEMVASRSEKKALAIWAFVSGLCVAKLTRDLGGSRSQSSRRMRQL